MCTLSEWGKFIAMIGLISLPVMFVGASCYILYRMARDL
jgi:hypothetical protein